MDAHTRRPRLDLGPSWRMPVVAGFERPENVPVIRFQREWGALARTLGQGERSSRRGNLGECYQAELSCRPESVCIGNRILRVSDIKLMCRQS